MGEPAGANILRKRIIEGFKKGNAIGLENAKTLEELQLKKMKRTLVFKRFIAMNVIGEDEDRYYITDSYAQSKDFKVSKSEIEEEL